MVSSWNMFLFFLSVGRISSEAVLQNNLQLNWRACDIDIRGAVESYLRESRATVPARATRVECLSVSTDAGGVGDPQRPLVVHCGESCSQQFLSRRPCQDVRKYADENLNQESQSQLQEAASSGDAARVRRLVASGASVEARDAQGDTPLHAAARHAHLEAVAALLQAGARAGARGRLLRTPLHWAAHAGSLEAVERLLAAGAPADAADATGATALVLAARANRSDVVVRLARPDAVRDDADARGDTPLVRAARAGDWAWAVQLARLGAAPTRRGAGGDSALVLAARAGRADALRQLLSGGGACDAREVARAVAEAGSASVVWELAEAAPDLTGGEPGEEGLRRAAAKCNRDVLSAFLSLGVDPNAANGESDSATLVAAKQGHVDCVKVLRARGAAPLQGPAAEGVLRQEAKKCRYEVLAALLAAGVDVNGRNKHNETALLLAAESRHVRCVKLLREHGADRLQGPVHEEALRSAAQNGNRGLVVSLLAAGVDPNAPNRNETTALMLSTQKGHLEVARDLLQYGAKKLEGDEGGNELSTACMSNEAKIVKSLLEAGAAYNRRNEIGESPIHDAGQGGCIGCIQALLDAGENLNARDSKGETALHEAAYYGNIEVIDFLLKAGASVNCRDFNGETPLHECVFTGYPSCIQLLLAGGADIEAVDNNKETPCHKAVLKSRVTSLQELLNVSDRCVNSTDIHGKTPLHVAASQRCEECIKVLVEAKVDINKMDNENDTALHVAVRNGCKNCAKILIENGGNVTLLNNKLETALTLANSDVMRKILEN